MVRCDGWLGCETGEREKTVTVGFGVGSLSDHGSVISGVRKNREEEEV